MTFTCADGHSPSTSPGRVRGGGNDSLSALLLALLVCSLIVPFPLHCPAEQNQLERHIPCYCKSLFVLNNSWNWLDWLLDKQDERGVAQGVLGIYPHTTQEQPVSYLLQSGRKLSYEVLTLHNSHKNYYYVCSSYKEYHTCKQGQWPLQHGKTFSSRRIQGKLSL